MSKDVIFKFANPNDLSVVASQQTQTFGDGKITGPIPTQSTTVLIGVVIGAGITSIEPSAFLGCTSLATVSGMEGVTSIGANAFNRCSSLAEVLIPTSVTSIGAGSFYMCTSLKSVIGMGGVTSIGGGAFYGAFGGCTSLVAVSIPTSVTSIGVQTFNGCTLLKSVSGMGGVTSIGISAFYGCTSLTAVTIKPSVTSIGENAFYKCAALKSVLGMEGVTRIDQNAFKDCWSLKSVTFPTRSLTTIGPTAFLGSGLAKVTLYYGTLGKKSPAKNVKFFGVIVEIIIIGRPPQTLRRMIFNAIDKGRPLGAHHHPNTSPCANGGAACARAVQRRT